MALPNHSGALGTKFTKLFTWYRLLIEVLLLAYWYFFVEFKWIRESVVKLLSSITEVTTKTPKVSDISTSRSKKDISISSKLVINSKKDTTSFIKSTT